VKSSNSIDGWDSILSILQMPNGVPVATVALNAAKNAGILAAQMLATNDPALLKKIIAYKEEMKSKVMDAAGRVEQAGKKSSTGNKTPKAGKKTAKKTPKKSSKK
jgi:5-(carboxyamino)imidazole ribonucleotide mutase